MTTQEDPTERLGRWCADQHGATQDNTFGPETDVYRIGNKIFAMVNHDGPGYITLKAHPDDALALRDQYDFIRPGYYMNKRHWITVDIVPDTEFEELPELVAESYRIVFASLTKARRSEIGSGDTAH